MTAPRPVRLRLSREKGYRLQDHSFAVNGLPAVNCARTSTWGNRWKIGTHSNALGRAVETAKEAVDLYRKLAWPEDHHRAWVRENLRGKNLACWCSPGEPCHADVLLKLANTPICEAIR